MKRLALLFAMIASLGVLAACGPTARVETNVLPTLFSAKAELDTNLLVLQGRNFGDGRGGQHPSSYVLVGSDLNGSGGVRAEVVSWGPGRIEATVPGDAGFGYVFVVVAGIRSNGLTVNLP